MEREPQKDFRDIQGEWTREQVEALAQEMMAEEEFNDIVFAGHILLKNQRGQTSFSEVSPMFTDDPIRVVTRNTLPASTLFRQDTVGLMESQIRETGRMQEIHLAPKTDQPALVFSARPRLKFDVVTIAKQPGRNLTDFFFRFAMGKEIYNILAFHHLTEECINLMFRDKWHIPEDNETKNALRVHSMRSAVEGIPLSVLADMWAHFLMLPNFNLARDRGKIGDENFGGMSALGVFEASSRKFMDMGILLKTEQGGYEWVKDKDYDRFCNAWFSVGVGLGQILMGRV